MVLLLEVKINQEMLIAQAALRRNEFFCRARQKRSIQRRHARIGKKPGRTEQCFLFVCLFFFSRDHINGPLAE